MFARRAVKAVAVTAAVVLCIACSLAIAAGTAGATTVANAIQAQSPFTTGTFDSGQPVDVVVPAGSGLTPGANIFILECSAPDGVDPATSASCDGNTGYQGGTITVQPDGSLDVMDLASDSQNTTSFGDPYTIYALPDAPSLHESPTATPRCGLGSANECVLYIGQGGGGDTGFSQPHVFSQAFQVRTDPTDSGSLSPGDGTFPADSAPAFTSANQATLVQGSPNTFTATASGWPPPTFSSGTLPSGLTLNAATGVLSGTPSGFGTFPVTLTASNGVGTNATQSFTLTVEPSVSGETLPGSAAAQSPFTAGTFDSGQPIDVVVPPNPVFTPGHNVYVLECSAPKGVDPTSTASCDGNSGYQGGTITVQSDGSVDVINTSTAFGDPYNVYALPDAPSLHESPAATPRCGLGSANECVLYIGEGGGGDTGMTQPHFFSQPFQVHPDPTDSGTLNPGDGTFGADSAPVFTSANQATFVQDSPGTFSVTASGYGPPAFTESGALPTGVTLTTTYSGTTSTGVLSGTPVQAGTFPIIVTASNGVGTNATQSFTLTVEPDVSGDTLPGSAAAQSPFTAGTFDSGQPIDVVVPPNPVFTPGHNVYVLECSAPKGVDPTSTASCDGNSGYQGGTITVQSDGSVDLIDTSTAFGDPYTLYALPDAPSLHEGPAATPRCGLGSANECVLYIGEGGGGDTGMTQPHFFSQPFQVHPDPTDSGTLDPGDGTFGADVAPGAISTANNATFTKGTAGTFSIDATGYGPPAYTETGTLPAGVTLKTTYSGLTSTGVLAGTPSQGGTFPITITANNGVGTPTTQAFTLTVDAAPQITSANSYTMVLGNSPSFTAAATGTPAPTFSDPGPLDGLSLGTNGALTGTATATGTFASTITASNGVGTPATQPFTLTVDAAPQITSANSYTMAVGGSPSFTATATGFPAPTFSDPGPLDGLSIDTNSGALTGTATAPGTFSSTITASNGVGTPATQPFTLNVIAAPVAPHITSAPDTSFTDGVDGSFTVTATGNPAPTFTETGAPSGVTLTTGGLLSGTPTATGTFTIMITAANGVSPDDTQSFTLTVLGFHISTTSLPDAVAGQAYSQQLQTLGGGPSVSWKKVSLPKGLTLSATGLLSGVPSTKAVGPTEVSVTATNGKHGTVASATIPFTVDEAPGFGKKPLVAAAFNEGTPGTATVTATGYPTPTITEVGALPSGVSFVDGVLSGTPAVTVNSGIYTLMITASNGITPAAQENFTLTVYAPLAVSGPASLPVGTAGVAYGPVSFTATGADGIYTWKKVSLPKGLAISATGVLSGTPKSAGSYTVTVEVESKDGKLTVSTDYSLSLTVS